MPAGMSHLQLFKLLDEFRSQDVYTGGELLPNLDEGGPQPDQALAQPGGQLGFALRYSFLSHALHMTNSTDHVEPYVQLHWAAVAGSEAAHACPGAEDTSARLIACSAHLLNATACQACRAHTDKSSYQKQSCRLAE